MRDGNNNIIKVGAVFAVLFFALTAFGCNKVTVTDPITSQAQSQVSEAGSVMSEIPVNTPTSEGSLVSEGDPESSDESAVAPTTAPTDIPTTAPTAAPTKVPTSAPTQAPTQAPTPTPLPKVGDIVNFGKYEQDNNLENGKEPIEWRVLEVSDGKALLLSDKCIDAKPYDIFRDETSWAICTLRTWLNADFINTAFNEAEASEINLSSIINTYGGGNTQDKVFLLSVEELESYFATHASRIAFNTPYAKAQGSYEFTPGIGHWLLRRPYKPVDSDGYWDRGFAECDVVLGIRPAIWLNLE